MVRRFQRTRLPLNRARRGAAANAAPAGDAGADGIAPGGGSTARERRGERTQVRGPLRGVLAGVGAWKLGGGLISTVLIFIVLYWLLGSC